MSSSAREVAAAVSDELLQLHLLAETQWTPSKFSTGDFKVIAGFGESLRALAEFPARFRVDSHEEKLPERRAYKYSKKRDFSYLGERCALHSICARLCVERAEQREEEEMREDVIVSQVYTSPSTTPLCPADIMRATCTLKVIRRLTRLDFLSRHLLYRQRTPLTLSPGLSICRSLVTGSDGLTNPVFSCFMQS